MCQYHYRITMDGGTPKFFYIYPSTEWSRVAEVCEERGLPARFERRMVCRAEGFSLEEWGLEDSGALRVGNNILFPWETWAEMRSE